jgi:hypothetical protein
MSGSSDRRVGEVYEKPVEPTSEWLEGYKQMDIDDMLIDLTLLEDHEFVRAMDVKIHGEIPEAG